MIRTIAGRLPSAVRYELKRWNYWLQIGRGAFVSPEPEFRSIADLYLRPGDVAADIGANVGHYTRDFARAVGPTGRVIAFEPIPQTFGMLAGNVRDLRNVTLYNAAASSQAGFVRMSIPAWGDGTPDNLYRSQIVVDGDHNVMSLPLDALNLKSLRLLKIDAEGHEPDVIDGARETIKRCSPVIIIENPNRDLRAWFTQIGYTLESTAADSPNVVAVPRW